MEIDKACKQIAKDLNLDYGLVRKIVYYQFKFIVDIMKDDQDIHDILLNELFKFKLKPRFKNNKQANYSPNNKNNGKENNEGN